MLGRALPRATSVLLILAVALTINLLGLVRGVAAVGVGDYSATTIPGLAPGGTYTNLYDVNDAGTVVGADANTSQAIRWTGAGGTVALDLPAGIRQSVAYATNASGQSVGFVQLPITFDTHAYRWNAGAGGADLGVLPGGTQSAANDINDSGAAAGYSNDLAGNTHAVRWNADGTIVDLGIPAGYLGSAAIGINNVGQIVGSAFDYSASPYREQAYLWSASGTPQALGFLPGGGYSSAARINNAGVVIGLADNASGELRIFRWTASEGMVDLGVPPGDYAESITITALNDLGQFGGRAFNGTDQHAFVWFPGSGFSDLVDLDGATVGSINGQVFGLNNRGQIVGYADNPDRGLLLTPNDTTAPVTTATPIGTPGNGGVVRSDVAVNLTTNDSGDPTPFGVARITYSASGAQAIPPTNASGASAAVPISAEGTTVLTFSAIDNAGNVEVPKSLTVQIDKTAPTLTTTVTPTSAQPGQTVMITVATSEPLAGSPTVTAAGTCIGTTTVPMAAGPTPGAYTGTYTLPGDAGVCTVTVTATGTDSAGNFSTGGTATFASLGAPPAVTLDRMALEFGNQRVGTTGSPQRIILTNVGGRSLAIGATTLGGAHPTDFVIAYTSCAGSLVSQQSCVIGVSFAPTALGARSGILTLSDDAAGSPRTIALTGNGAVGNFVVAASVSGGGTVTPSGTTAYVGGTVAAFAASPGAGQIFLGWTLDEQFVGYANPLDFTVNGDRTLVARFAPRPAFADVSPSDPDYEAIARLAALGVINPAGVNGTSNFEPGRAVLRAEVAAFVARLFGWDDEFHRNTFPDRCAPDGGFCVDDELWNNVAALADYGIVGGYTDAPTCASAGTTAPCYLPRDNVSRLQVVSVVARAFIKVPDLRTTGYWERLPAAPGQYANVPDAGTQRSDLATYRANAGPVPGQVSDGQFPEPDAPASRRFVIQVLCQAYQAQFGIDRVP